MIEIKMMEVYSYLSERIKNWCDPETFEWQEEKKSENCRVYIFEKYVSVEDQHGNEIYYGEII